MLASLTAFSQRIFNVLPNLIGAVLLLLVGWLIARGVRLAIRKLLRSRALHRMTEQLNKLPLLNSANLSVDSLTIVSQFVYWVILLIFFIAASETLGWTAVSTTLNNLINYLPALLSAIVIVLIGLYLAQTVRNVMQAALHSLQIGAGKLISSLAFYLLSTLVILTALEQAGIDTRIVTANLTLVIGAIVGAFAIGFALASRPILENILASFYGRKNFTVGDRVRVDAIEGVIVRIDTVSVVVNTGNSEVVLPAQTLVTERIEKLK